MAPLGPGPVNLLNDGDCLRLANVVPNCVGTEAIHEDVEDIEDYQLVFTLHI